MPRLVCQSSGETLIERLQIAETFWSRFRGLQFRPTLPPAHALWLNPCSSLHTAFMRFDIDVVWLSEDLTILQVGRGIRPWRLAFGPRGTRSVIESAVGAATWRPGNRVRVERD